VFLFCLHLSSGDTAMVSFCFFVWSLIALPVAQAQPYLMNDVGGTLHLPKGWEADEWADWSFKAKGGGGAILYKLWTTPLQSELNDESAKVWVELYKERLADQGLKDPKVVKTEIKDVAGRRTILTEMDVKFGGKGSRGQALFAAFAGEGQIIHSRVISNTSNFRKARVGFMETLDSFELGKGPLKSAGSAVSSGAGFAATLPDGWRAPFDPEKSAVMEITSKMWPSDLSSDKCWSAIKPPALGDPDVMFACSKPWSGGPVDEYSFAGVEAEWRSLFFGEAGSQLPEGEQIQVGDRMGAMFRPRDGQNPIRLLVAPYSGGVMVVWFRGASADVTSADTALKSVASSVQYTDAEGGQPIVRVDHLAGYYLTHRPTSPIVWGPILLVLGGIVVLVRRRSGRSPYEDFDDVTEA
jgi:hypothetical protein